MKSKYLLRSTVVAAAIAGAYSASAATISVNFTGNQPGVTLAPTDATGITPVSNWSNLDGGTGSAADLTDDSGTATTTDATWSASGGWSDGSANTGTPDANLLRGYLDDTTAEGPSVTLTNIPYANYNLIIYHSSDDTGLGDWREVTLSTTDTGSAPGPVDQFGDDPGFASRTVSFSNLSGSSLTFSTPGRNGADRGTISGFQVVEVIPEPSSTAMLGLASLGLLIRRKRS